MLFPVRCEKKKERISQETTFFTIPPSPYKSYKSSEASFAFSVFFILGGAAWGPWAQAPPGMKETEKKTLNTPLIKGPLGNF